MYHSDMHILCIPNNSPWNRCGICCGDLPGSTGQKPNPGSSQTVCTGGWTGQWWPEQLTGQVLWVQGFNHAVTCFTFTAKDSISSLHSLALLIALPSPWSPDLTLPCHLPMFLPEFWTMLLMTLSHWATSCLDLATTLQSPLHPHCLGLPDFATQLWLHYL